MGLAEKMQLPVAVAATAKAVIDEAFPHYVGMYNGKGSQPQARAIEDSDCLLFHGIGGKRQSCRRLGDAGSGRVLAGDPGHIRSGGVLIAEDGTSCGAFGLQLRRTVPSSRRPWGSIGYSVGSLLGTLAAAPDRRHLLFVGDGSFQLTAQELPTMLRHDYVPVIFLINSAYTIERCYLGKTSRYNDVDRQGAVRDVLT
jgi:TPP-dependent 2-oxoacid decarboxylase